MTPELWSRIEDLFLKAVELPQDSREKFLDEVCQGDESLRKELDSMLAYDDPATPLFESPFLSANIVDEAADTDAAGRRIGPYRLVRLLGRGGMGGVHLAVRDDDHFQQQVAIKLVNRGMDTDSMLARFRQERQILANLEHPFIARLLDGGATDDGLPYFVMEYVDGQPITRYCAEKNLSIPERLRLFRLVCEAVQHAHQNLVVHRDIKPSNILTTKEGIPKLLDFGIAKVIDSGASAGVTLTFRELRVLTPDYASPEQAKGLSIGTASDIYSLGVVLYELLTDQRPHQFPSSSPFDIERTICDVEPGKPSVAAGQHYGYPPSLRKQLRRQLSGDLDNIILTALRKEPERRYASVAEFSDDLRRHMEGLPILAQEDQWSYRAGKFIRRNRLAVAAAFLVVVSLIGGILTTASQARRAERRFGIARSLANRMLFDLHDQVQQLPGSTRARASMIETVVGYLDNLARDAGQDPSLKMEMAKAYHRIGAIEGHPFQSNLGRTVAARTHYQKARALLQTLAEQADTHASAIDEMIHVDIETGDIEAAAGNREAAKELYKNAATLVDSVEVSPATEVYAYFRLGDIEAQEGSAGAAVPHYRKALERTQAWAASGREAEPLRTLRMAHSRLANALRESGDLFACRDNLRQALELVEERLRQADRTAEDRRNWMIIQLALAEVYGGHDDLNLGEFETAIKYYRAAMALADELASADRNDMRARRSLAVMCRRMGRALFDRSPAEALSYYVKALEIAEELRASDAASIDFRRDVVEANLGLGILSRKSGRMDDAMKHLTRALELQKTIEAAAPTHVWFTRYMSQIHVEIGNVLAQSGDEVRALKSYQEALEAADRLLARAPTSLYLERDRADVLEATGRYYQKASAQPNLPRGRRTQLKAEARSWLRKSRAIWQSWTKRGVAAPYASKRDGDLAVAMALLGKP